MRPWEQTIFELPAEEKIKLIRALWESVEQDVLNENIRCRKKTLSKFKNVIANISEMASEERRGKL